MTGHEATTLTLGFSIWEISRNPDIQQRLRAELQSFSAEPTYDDYLSKLPYLDAILKETYGSLATSRIIDFLTLLDSLRMYPGLPYMERVATKHDVIPLSRPIDSSNGRSLNEVQILPGQVGAYLGPPFAIISYNIGTLLDGYYSDYCHTTFGPRLEGR
jgi:hypothetical protein